MAAIQVNSADLAAVAHQGTAKGRAGNGAGGFFAQALAAASGSATGVQPVQAAAAEQSSASNLPADFLASRLSDTQLGAALTAQVAQAGQAAQSGEAGQPAQASQGAQAAKPANPLLAEQAQGEQTASALFNQLATQLAELGAGNGDPKQVAAQLTALGLTPGDFKQVVGKLAKGESAGTDADTLGSALRQLAQHLASGQAADPALLGAVAAQLAALQGAAAGTPVKLEKAADIADDRKALPVAGAKTAAATGGGDAPGKVLAAKVESPAGAASKPSFAEQLAVDAKPKDGADLASKLLGGDVQSLKPSELVAVATSTSTPVTQPPDANVMRTDGLGLVTAAPKVTPDMAAQAALQVPTPLRAPGWDADFAQKVVWVAGRDSQSAQLVLNPPQLGAVEVRLTVTGGEAGAQFFSPHHNVREAIESAMPRLREMMAQAGLSLGQASVSSQSFRDQRSNPGNPGQFAASGSDGDAEATQTILPVGRSSNAAIHGLGLVDLYA